MKLKKLFVAIAVLITVALGFTACIEGGEKYNVSYSSPAVVGSGQLEPVLLSTIYGDFIPDDSALTSLTPGSCIYMNFEYNSAYQTAGSYPVASGVQYKEVETSSIVADTEVDPDTYNYPFSSVALFYESLSPNYKGRFFVTTTAKLATNQALDHVLYYKSDENPDETGTRNIYLQANLPATQTSAQDVTNMLALDMRSLFDSSGRDTTIQEYDLKYLKVNLKYISDIKDETPVYESATAQPIYIYILN